MANCQSIIILSEKSSGSSACQDLLSEFADIRHVSRTRHFENETLYWTKAASILGRRQRKMVDSEVPIPPERARSDLIELLRDNLDDYQPPDSDEKLIMDGWRRLCRQHARWKSPPAKVEEQWQSAYRNLLRLKHEAEDHLVIVRYEDMVSSLECLQPVFEFCGVQPSSSMDDHLHRHSLQTARNDTSFGFALSEETRQLAEEYGYTRDDTANDAHALWPLSAKSSRVAYLARRSLRRLARRILDGLHASRNRE